MVVLGRLVRAVGLGGEIKLRPTADFWEAALGSDHLLLQGAGERRPVSVAGYRRQGAGAWVVRLGGIADRQAAEAVVGSDLVLDGAPDVAPPEKLRPFQVRGWRVELADGTLIGTVTDLVPMPAQDVLVVRGPEREHWIPAVAPIVRRVDFEAGVISVDPPAGLLEL